MGRRGLAGIACVAALATGLLACAPAVAHPRVPPSFLGVNYAFYPYVSQREAAQMASGGVGTVRFGLEWFHVERQQGKYDWSDSDKTIGNLASHGIKSIPVLFGTPYWATQNSIAPPPIDLPILFPHANGTAYPPNDTATGATGWSNFVRAAARRYGPGGSFWRGPYRRQHRSAAPVPVRTWQVWNEPNIGYYFWPQPSVPKYAGLVELTHSAVTRVDPGATLALGGLPCRAEFSCTKYLRELFARSGIERDFDLVAIHPYAPSVNYMLKEIRQARQVIDRHGDPRTRIWVSELGWGSDPPTSHYNEGLRGQARMLTHSFSALRHRRRSLGIEGLSWFDWRDASEEQPSCSWCSHAGLFTSRGKAKPSWRAFRRAAGR
jgi:hypothetical protein